MSETAKTVDQALSVLIELTESGATTPAELARRLDLNRTVVHRLLSTLQQRGFVTRQENGYVPGAVLVWMAERVQPELRAAAAGIMAKLGKEIGETIVMHIADGDDAMVLDQYVSAEHVLRVEHEIGSRHPLVSGASGRALLAFLAQPTVSRVLRRIEDPDAVTRELEAVRAIGYSISHDELQNGVHGLAVPILDRPDHALASLAIIAPASRAAGLARHRDVLTAAASQIATSLYGEMPVSARERAAASKQAKTAVAGRKRSPKQLAET